MNEKLFIVLNQKNAQYLCAPAGNRKQNILSSWHVVCCKLAPTSASHNYVISPIECLILTVSQSTILRVYSLQFLCKSTHSGIYKRKCFFLITVYVDVYRRFLLNF